jgi:hypothetical protein
MIIRAAVQIHTYDGRDLVLPLHRHCDARDIMIQFGYKESDYRRDMEGFLTDEGEFLDRCAALDHAIACGQIDPEAPEHWDLMQCGVMFSEDLW